MSDVRVPEVQVSVTIEGQQVARFGFARTGRNPADWEVTGALDYADSKQAMRALFLACVVELDQGSWEAYTFVPEGDSQTDDQLQLPWS